MMPGPEETAPRRRWWLDPRVHAGAWAVVIAVLLFSSGPETGAVAPWLRRLEAFGGDKVVHWGLFLVQAALVVRALPPSVPFRSLAIAFSAVTLYGALTEMAQFALPERSAELADLAADSLGALTGILGALLLRRLR